MGSPSLPGLAGLLAAAVALAACAEIAELTDLPKLEPEHLEIDLTPQTSLMFDHDGQVLAAFHGEKDRTVVPLERVPRHGREAVIAIEDERFYEHEGVDLQAIARAAAANVDNGGVVQGGSTITQQYVKNAIIAPGRDPAELSLRRKIDEAALARQLEQRLGKDEILERYINTVYFGNGAYGVQAAARTYFSKPARRLTLRESSLLAGLIRSPRRSDPFRNRERARSRRSVVLAKMAELGMITGKRADRVERRKLGLKRDPNGDRYDAPYFVDYVKRLLTHAPRFAMIGDTVEERSDRLFRGGLRIHTTLDRRAQEAAEQAINAVLTEKNDPRAALVSIEPETGHVKAMVGGRNYFAPKKRDRFAKLNLAIPAARDLGGAARDGESRAPGTGRQAGSAFKTFALAAGLEEGISLLERFQADSCMSFAGADAGQDWEVCNYEGSAFGSVSLLEATTKSINVVYAQLILELGAENVVDAARRMGIRSTDLSAVPSAALGTSSVNALDMASAYATLARNGQYHPPVAVTKIVDTTTGEVIFEDRSSSQPALDPGVAYVTTRALQGVIESGTGTGANIGRPAAGKTGTAQEYRDAWFAGYTPDLATAVWVGYPDASIEMKTSCSTTNTSICRTTRTTVTGGSWPAMIWRDFMASALAGIPARDFERPTGLVEVVIDTRAGCIAGPGTPDRYRATALFLEGSEPTERCPRPDDRDKRKGEKKSDDKEQRRKSGGGRGRDGGGGGDDD